MPSKPSGHRERAFGSGLIAVVIVGPSPCAAPIARRDSSMSSTHPGAGRSRNGGSATHPSASPPGAIARATASATSPVKATAPTRSRCESSMKTLRR